MKNVLASSPFNLILLMVPQAQHKPMVDRIVTFKLSLAMGAWDRMVQFNGTILTYGWLDTVFKGCPNLGPPFVETIYELSMVQ